MRKFLCLIFLFLLIITGSDKCQAETFETPDTGYVSNVAIDILSDNGIIWLATDDGLNYSLDSGLTWLIHSEDNGLVSDNVSAMFYSNGRIYVALNHSENVQGEMTSISDGLIYSDDLGQNWQTVDFDADSIIYSTGGDRTIFDLTGYGQRVFAAAFAGGILATADDGDSWYRLFASKRDSINYYEGHVGLDTLSLINRYFSARVDTSHFNDPATTHDDSLFLWVGTAGGLQQYVFVDPHGKPSSERINSIAISDSNSVMDNQLLFWGSDNGVTRSSLKGTTFQSWFDESDLNYKHVTAVGYVGEKIFVATLSEDGTTPSISMIDSTDWKTFDNLDDIFPPDTSGETYISQFGEFQNFYLFSAGHRGLFYSDNYGVKWHEKLLDTLDRLNAINHAYCFDSVDDTLYIGSDTGLIVAFYEAGTLTLDSFFVQTFAETDSSSTKISKLKIQEFADSLILWSIHEPISNGTRFVGRNNISRLRDINSWQHLQVDAVVNDIAFKGDTAFVVGEEGIRYNIEGYNPTDDYEIKEYIDSFAIDSLNYDTITVFTIVDSLRAIGTTNGFAISDDDGVTYNIVRVNTNPQKHDLSVYYGVGNSFLNMAGELGITGNWIPALEVQYLEDQPAAVWLSTRSTGSEGDTYGFGISRGRETALTNDDNDTLLVRFWELFYDGDFAWNYAFNGDTVFAATNSGLLMNSTGTPLVWDTVQLVDEFDELQVLGDAPIYAVEVFGGYVWVGSDDRMVRLNLDNLKVEKTFFVQDTLTSSEQVYAFPVPYSHTNDYGVNFHFVVEQDANITIEIYDFSMTLVKTVVNNRAFTAGTYPTSGSSRVVWDGTNGNGEKVAVGIYYFKVEYSTGEVRWDKIAVIP